MAAVFLAGWFYCPRRLAPRACPGHLMEHGLCPRGSLQQRQGGHAVRPCLMASAPTHPLSPARDTSACLSSRVPHFVTPWAATRQASLPFAISRRLPREWVGCLEICFSENHSLGQALKGGAGQEPVRPICSLPLWPWVVWLRGHDPLPSRGMVCKMLVQPRHQASQQGLKPSCSFLPGRKARIVLPKKKNSLRKEKHKQHMCQIAKGVKDRNTASKVTWA